jgi:hypothetical protein
MADDVEAAEGISKAGTEDEEIVSGGSRIHDTDQ